MAERDFIDEERQAGLSTGVPIWIVLASWVGKGIGALLFIAVVLAVVVWQLFSRLMEAWGQMGQKQAKQGTQRRRTRTRR